MQQHPQQVQPIGVAAIDREQLAIEQLGLIQPAELLIGQRLR